MRPWMRELLIGVATTIPVVLFMVLFSVTNSIYVDPWELDLYIIAVHALAVVGVMIRRQWPGIALGLVTASALLQMIGLWPPMGVNIAQLIVVYACAARGTRSTRWVALATLVLGAIIGGIYTGFFFVTFQDEMNSAQSYGQRLILVMFEASILYFAVLVSSWALGMVDMLIQRNRRERIARRIAEVETEHVTRAMASERERARIAREMHDVLAHSLVVIATLSDGARYVIRDEPERADETMATVGEVARDALADVRRLLAELRYEQDASPAPEHADVDELITRFNELGLSVTRVRVGEPRPLTPGASLTAYRAVQEGLTNALRHGDRSQPVELTEAWTAEHLSIFIRNSLRPSTSPAPSPDRSGSSAAHLPSGGHGLLGLRERVQLEGGVFTAGREAGAFTLRVLLPAGREQLAERPAHPIEQGTPIR